MSVTPPQFGSSPDRSTWVLDLHVEAVITRSDGVALDRDGFTEWLWEHLGDAGLSGVVEGSIDVSEAVAAGLVSTPLVIDAAEAPADRDWVREACTATLACWFDDEAAARAAASLLATVGGCRVVDLREAAATDAGDWRASFEPVSVPGFGTVCPAWIEGEAGADGPAGGTTIFIEPGVGFGTGLHDTTQLCLAAIAAAIGTHGPATRMLDFGSGSGILGIAAAVGGAEHVDAVEVDLAVHGAIRGNAMRNGVDDRVRVWADLPAAGPPYDLVVANIVAGVLLQCVGPLSRAVRRDAGGGLAGVVVLSGLLAGEVQDVAAAYAATLGGPPVVTARGGWHCLQWPRSRAEAGGASCP